MDARATTGRFRPLHPLHRKIKFGCSKQTIQGVHKIASSPLVSALLPIPSIRKRRIPDLLGASALTARRRKLLGTTTANYTASLPEVLKPAVLPSFVTISDCTWEVKGCTLSCGLRGGSCFGSLPYFLCENFIVSCRVRPQYSSSKRSPSLGDIQLQHLAALVPL